LTAGVLMLKLTTTLCVIGDTTGRGAGIAEGVTMAEGSGVAQKYVICVWNSVPVSWSAQVDLGQESPSQKFVAVEAVKVNPT